jgi:hypothetical protein
VNQCGPGSINIFSTIFHLDIHQIFVVHRILFTKKYYALNTPI